MVVPTPGDGGKSRSVGKCSVRDRTTIRARWINIWRWFLILWESQVGTGHERSIRSLLWGLAHPGLLYHQGLWSHLLPSIHSLIHSFLYSLHLFLNCRASLSGPEETSRSFTGCVEISACHFRLPLLGAVYLGVKIRKTRRNNMTRNAAESIWGES